MRAHWSIENNLHKALDAILHEDYCLLRKDNAAANITVLIKIALNILNHVDFSDIIKVKKMPLVHKRHLCDRREDGLQIALLSLYYNAEFRDITPCSHSSYKTDSKHILRTLPLSLLLPRSDLQQKKFELLFNFLNTCGKGR